MRGEVGYQAIFILNPGLLPYRPPTTTSPPAEKGKAKKVPMKKAFAKRLAGCPDVELTEEESARLKSDLKGHLSVDAEFKCYGRCSWADLNQN